MSGLVAKAGSQGFAGLPSELEQQPAPQISRIFAADGRTQIAVMYDEFRSDVPLSQIPATMRNAIVAAEDHQFYEHNGVDLKGVARAFVNNHNGGARQGASTLTMQYVRMALAYTARTPGDAVAATEDTPGRKLAEMKYAMQLEKELSKEQILERYLNMAPFGNGAYGVYAACQVYFKKRPKDLTVAEAALLAGMVKAPTAFDPTTDGGHPQATARRDYIVDNMRDLGFVTAQQATAAKKTEVSRAVTRAGSGCRSFFCDYFYRWWLSQQAFGANAYERERRLKSGGYRVVTSLDVRTQASARTEITKVTKDTNRNALMLAAVQPGTGRVQALAANRKYSPDTSRNKRHSDPELAARGQKGTYPSTVNPIITGGGDISGYQAGSVFKMFTMVAALENGYDLDHKITSGSTYRSKYVIDPGSPTACPGTHFYCPHNASPSLKGTYDMWTGFGQSVNTYFVPLQEQVGAAKVIDAARRFGVRFRAGSDAAIAGDPAGANQWGAFTLGVSSSTPLDIASAYATLAADGLYCTPTPVRSITSAGGAELAVGRPDCTRATSAGVARKALDAARCPVGDRARLGTCRGATAPQVRSVVGHPVFGKTGTTDGDNTASMVVGTRDVVVAGYLANPDWSAHRDPMRHDIVNPAVYRTVADYMHDRPRREFP
ncbi:transglycosylase domain-containing protein [Actinoplanes sp. M2I2]|uniref:transglycosylase domain-containing protein n=1 Tax=Actinoplanes sp. M2I2 TaxID=1734444 RepID=UPI0024C2E1B8